MSGKTVQIMFVYLKHNSHFSSIFQTFSCFKWIIARMMLLSPELICPPGDSNEIINAGTAQWFQLKISTCIVRPPRLPFSSMYDWTHILSCHSANTPRIWSKCSLVVRKYWHSHSLLIYLFYFIVVLFLFLDQEKMSLTDVTHILMQWHRFEEKRSFLKVGYVLCTVITDIMFTLFYRSRKISSLWMCTRFAVFSFLFQLGALDMEFLLQTVPVCDSVTYSEICGCR